MHTQKLDIAIAAAPYVGFIPIPYRPIASGMHTALYMNAQKRFSWIFFIVARLRRIAAETSVRLFFITTISAASTATSAPAPIAIPVSAAVSAGASLIPSPTMMTFPCFFSSDIFFDFPSGRTPAITLSTPACLPIAFAVRSLSPVSIYTLSPMPLSSFIASAESLFIVSATAMIPIKPPPFANSNGVFPSSESAVIFAVKSVGTLYFREIYLQLPPSITLPSSTAERPFPASALKSVTSGTVMPLVFAVIAFASGCSLLASSADAYVSSSFSVMPYGMISVTSGLPSVMVPVLSSAAIFALPTASRDAAVL